MKPSRVLVVLHPSLMPPDSLEGQAAKAIEEWPWEFVSREGHRRDRGANQRNQNEAFHKFISKGWLNQLPKACVA